MTTIAYRDGIIACDSCYSHLSAIDTLSSKIYRLRSGALLGQAGPNDSRLFVSLLENVKTFKQLPSYQDLLAIRSGFLGLIILPDKTIAKIATTFTSPENFSDDDEADIGVWRVETESAAIGTGSDFALGAMSAGASARQAVRIACRLDMNSRLPVHTLYLGGKK